MMCANAPTAARYVAAPCTICRQPARRRHHHYDDAGGDAQGPARRAARPVSPHGGHRPELPEHEQLAALSRPGLRAAGGCGRARRRAWPIPVRSRADVSSSALDAPPTQHGYAGATKPLSATSALLSPATDSCVVAAPMVRAKLSRSVHQPLLDPFHIVAWATDALDE